METEKEKSKTEFLPSRVIAEDILISNNIDYKMIIENFLSSLSKKFDFYSNEIKKIEERWNNFKKQQKNNNVYIEPEQLSIKSPTTILNAPWGTGKTYFIEQIAINWNKLENKNFENFIVIDVWKFTTSSNIVAEIIKAIYLIISNIVFQNQDAEKIIKNILVKISQIIKKILPTGIQMVGVWLETYLPGCGMLSLTKGLSDLLKESIKSSKETASSINDLLNEINPFIKSSIIVFDNIERMGIHAWEIIKTIQQLSIFNNLLFILPINKSQLNFFNDFEYERTNESSIDKYITLGTYYNLKQDYLGILKKLEFEDDTAKLINMILNEDINGYNLSIRLIEKSFKANDIKKSFEKNKYEGLKQLKKIWNSKIIKEEIESDFLSLKNSFVELDEIYWSRQKEININDEITKINEFVNKYIDDKKLSEIKKFKPRIDEINKELIINNYNLSKILNFDWIEEWKKFEKTLKKFKKFLIKKKEEINELITKNDSQIKISTKANKKLNEKIEDNNSDILKIENKEIQDKSDSEKKQQLKNENETHNSTLSSNLKQLNKWELENNYFDGFLNDLNNLTNEYHNGFLDNFIGNYKLWLDKYIEKYTNITNDINKNKMLDTLKEINSQFEEEAEEFEKSLWEDSSSIFDYEPTLKELIRNLLK